jgi:hypothetical protein
LAGSVDGFGGVACCSHVAQPENAIPRQVTAAHIFNADRDTRVTPFPANLPDRLLVAGP